MAATNYTKAAFDAVIAPYLNIIYENAPSFGCAGITLIFHDGEITRIDITETVQKMPGLLAPRKGGTI